MRSEIISMSLSISTYSIMGKIAAYFTGVWPSLSMWTTCRTPVKILIVELVNARSIRSSAGQNTGGIYDAWRCCPLLRLVDPHLRRGSCKLVVLTFDGRSEGAVELHTSSSG